MNSTPTNEAMAIIGQALGDLPQATAQALVELGLIDTFGAVTTYEVPALGIDASTNESGVVIAVHLHCQGHEGCGAFPFEYEGVTFESNRADVRSSLGVPSLSGVGVTGPWDAYRMGEVRMHFVYSAHSMKIVLVTLEPSEMGAQ